MKRIIAVIAAIAGIYAFAAAETQKITIATEAADTAYMLVSLPGHQARAAVVICPGGGYTHLSMEKEGKEWAQWFNDRGIAAAVLHYRLPRQRNTVPLSDAMAAIDTMRQNAKKWNIIPGKVGIMGFSAGGHLATTAATHYTDPALRPDFQILMYPVVSMDTTITHRGTRVGLIGKQPSAEMERKYRNETQVTPQTPPAFIFTCQDDRAVHPDNSIRYYQALIRNDVPSQLHIYPKGGHGYGKRFTFPYTEQLQYLLTDFLNEQLSK